MAKALLLITAPEGKRDALKTQLSEGLEQYFSGLAHVTAQLMQQLEPDFFYDPGSPHPRPEFIVEIVTAPGRPLGSVQESMSQLLQGAPHDNSSLVLVMQERKFIPGPPQPFYYHYLMMKKSDFVTADYNDYYSNYHSSMGFQMPAIEGYSQNYIDQAASAALAKLLGLQSRDVTSISELKIPDIQALLVDPGLVALAEPAAADEAHFVDRDNSVSFTSEAILRFGDFEHIDEPVFEQQFQQRQ